MGDHHRRDRCDRGCDLRRVVRRRGARRPGPAARGAAGRGRGRRARRLAGGQRGDRGSWLVRHAARPRDAVAAGRGGRILRHAAGATPDPGGGARPGGTGHGEPPGVPALVPGGRGGLPAHHGPRSPARAVRPARGPGRHRRRHRRAAGRVQARAGHGPPRRPVAQRVRHDRSGRGPDPRRPHRIPAGPRHAVRRTDLRAPARADRDSRRAAAVRPAHHVPVRALASAGSPATRRAGLTGHTWQ